MMLLRRNFLNQRNLSLTLLRSRKTEKKEIFYVRDLLIILPHLQELELNLQMLEINWSASSKSLTLMFTATLIDKQTTPAVRAGNVYQIMQYA